MALIAFTLSNARRLYSSMGNPLGLKGLIKQQCVAGQFSCVILIMFGSHSDLSPNASPEINIQLLANT